MIFYVYFCRFILIVVYMDVFQKSILFLSAANHFFIHIKKSASPKNMDDWKKNSNCQENVRLMSVFVCIFFCHIIVHLSQKRQKGMQ